MEMTFRKNSYFHADEELQEHYRRVRDKALHGTDSTPVEPEAKEASFKEAAVDILSAAQESIDDEEYATARELIEQAKNLL